MGALVTRHHFPHDVERAVAGAIVGDHNLQWRIGLGESALDGLANEGFLVITPENKTDQRSVFHGSSKSATRREWVGAE